jgi:hypothetical protein
MAEELMKRSHLVAGLLGILLCGCAVRPPAAKAQYLGSVNPQTVQNTLAPSGTACTGSPQIYNVQNLGQTEHIASIISSGTQNTMSIEIDGVDVSGNVFKLSDTGLGNFGTNGTSLAAAGYYPIIRVSVTCTGASYTLTYAGFSSTAPVIAGTLFATEINKNLFYGVTANTGQASTFQTPFGNSSGTLTFSYGVAAISGSTLSVQCQSFITGLTSETFIFALANTTNVQTFVVPPASCPVATVNYNRGGAATGTVTVEYFFDPTQSNTTLGQYNHITGTTATAVKSTAGSLMGVTINTAAAGTVSVFDLPAASCTMTPSTNTVAVLTVNATDPPHATPYNVFLSNGICVKASAVMDITVGYQ